MHVCMLLFSGHPQNVRSDTTATSVVISWQQPTSSLFPDRYSVTLTYTNNTGTRNETLTRVVQVPGNATEVEYDQLASEQDYDYCVSAVYGPLTPTFCFSFQTAKSEREAPRSTSGGAAVGVLSAIIVLLLLLLVALGGMVLAYPRCIRSRVKDKKYLSRQACCYNFIATHAMQYIYISYKIASRSFWTRKST